MKETMIEFTQSTDGMYAKDERRSFDNGLEELYVMRGVARKLADEEVKGKLETKAEHFPPRKMTDGKDNRMMDATKVSKK